MQQPAKWSQRPLRELLLSTATWNPRNRPRELIHYVDVSAISREELRILRSPAIPTSGAPSRARKIVKAGDTILATVRPTLKRIAQIPASLDGEIVSTAFCVLRPDRQKVNPDFLFFAVQLEAVMSRIAALETGASYPAVRDSDVLAQLIPVPPLPDQFDIAAILKMARSALLHEAECETASIALKRGTMRELFTRGLKGEPQKETEIGPLPESWQARTILGLCDIWSGGTPRKSMAEYWRGNVPWVSGKDLKLPALDDAVDHLTPEGIEAGSRLAPAGAVLLLVRGMGLAKDLPVAVINRPMAFNQDVKALVSRGEFSGQFLRSAIYVSKERLLSRIVPSAHGTMTLNLNDIETFRVPCPADPTEADNISALLDAIDRKIDLHRKKRAVLDELFKAMLQKLMTGEIPAAALDLSALDHPTAASNVIPTQAEIQGYETSFGCPGPPLSRG
jgi:type I restriction enzyme, S subunit